MSLHPPPRPAAGVWPARRTAVFTLPGRSRDPSKPTTVKKEIANVEKQIAELTRRSSTSSEEGQAGWPGPAPPASSPRRRLKQMTWRCIGPANMGGRITAIAVVESRPDDLLGRHRLRRPAQDHQQRHHLRAPVRPRDHRLHRRRRGRAVRPEHRLGRHRREQPAQLGLLRRRRLQSTDGGKTWKNMGLKKSFQIGRIVIHPKNPDIVYVGALGRLYGPNEERGLFKTDRRRQDLEEGPLRRRQDRRHRHADGSVRSEHAAGRHVGAASATASTAISARRLEWPTPDQYGPEVTYGPGGGLFRSTDARQDLEEADRREGADTGCPPRRPAASASTSRARPRALCIAIIDTENDRHGPAAADGVHGHGERGREGRRSDSRPSVVEDGPVAKAGHEGRRCDRGAGWREGRRLRRRCSISCPRRRPNDVVKFTVKRGDKEVTADVKLAPRQGGGGGAAAAKGGGGKGGGGKGGGGKGGGGFGGFGKGGQPLLPGFYSGLLRRPRPSRARSRSAASPRAGRPRRPG